MREEGNLLLVVRISRRTVWEEGENRDEAHHKKNEEKEPEEKTKRRKQREREKDRESRELRRAADGSKS